GPPPLPPSLEGQPSPLISHDIRRVELERRASCPKLREQRRRAPRHQFRLASTRGGRIPRAEQRRPLLRREKEEPATADDPIRRRRRPRANASRHLRP